MSPSWSSLVFTYSILSKENSQSISTSRAINQVSPNWSNLVYSHRTLLLASLPKMVDLLKPSCCCPGR